MFSTCCWGTLEYIEPLSHLCSIGANGKLLCRNNCQQKLWHNFVYLRYRFWIHEWLPVTEQRTLDILLKWQGFCSRVISNNKISDILKFDSGSCISIWTQPILPQLPVVVLTIATLVYWLQSKKHFTRRPHWTIHRKRWRFKKWFWVQNAGVMLSSRL